MLISAENESSRVPFGSAKLENFDKEVVQVSLPPRASVVLARHVLRHVPRYAASLLVAVKSRWGPHVNARFRVTKVISARHIPAQAPYALIIGSPGLEHEVGCHAGCVRTVVRGAVVRHVAISPEGYASTRLLLHSPRMLAMLEGVSPRGRRGSNARWQLVLRDSTLHYLQFFNLVRDVLLHGLVPDARVRARFRLRVGRWREEPSLLLAFRRNVLYSSNPSPCPVPAA